MTKTNLNRWFDKNGNYPIHFIKIDRHYKKFFTVTYKTPNWGPTNLHKSFMVVYSPKDKEWKADDKHLALALNMSVKVVKK